MARIVRLIALSLLLLAIIVILHGCRNSLSRYFKQVQPGMSREDTERVVPSRLLQLDADPVTMPTVGTRLTGPVAKCAYRRTYASSWLLGSAEYGELYFDTSNRLVGLRYSSSGGPWSPSWGIEYR